MFFTGYILEPGIPTHHCVIHSDIDCIAISRTVRLISHGYFAMETYDANPSMIIYEYFSMPVFCHVNEGYLLCLLKDMGQIG